jgi:alkylation response protein AidB-like acyl-CoA dehydrogenase
MEFELSADQSALRDAAADLLAERADPAAVRSVVDAGGGWDRRLWGDLVEQGWAGLLVAEELGGVGLGWVEAAVLCETVGSRVAPAPVLSQLVATSALAEAGDRTWLDKLTSGAAVAAVSARPLEVSSGSSGLVVSGTTEPVAFAPSADVLLAVADIGAGAGTGTGADAGSGSRLVLVELGGERPEAEDAMDLTREFARVHLDSMPAIELGGPEGVQRHMDRGATAYAAEMLGCASAALDMAVAHAREREQFGRPIGSFQAIKHRCADMLVDVEGMRSATWWAAWCLATDDPQRSAAASTAKIWCSDAAERVLTSALQVHGGIGFTWESDLHLYLKRVEYDRRAFGTASWHRERLASMLRSRLEAGEPVIH